MSSNNDDDQQKPPVSPSSPGGVITYDDDDEVCSNQFSLEQLKWPSYLNLIKLAAKVASRKQRPPVPGDTAAPQRKTPLQNLMATTMTATQKLDGSNASFTYSFARIPEGELKAIHGRTAALWIADGFVDEMQAANDKNSGNSGNDDGGDKKSDNNTDNTSSDTAEIKKRADQDVASTKKLPGYGLAGSLGEMAQKVREYAARLYKIIPPLIKANPTELIIFGECFRAKSVVTANGGKQQEVLAAHASFHPFGLRYFDSNKKAFVTLRLTAKLHEIFTAAALLPANAPTPKTQEEMMPLLLNAKENLVFPPPLYTQGLPLVDAILSPPLSTVMVDPPGATPGEKRVFEGVFIILQSPENPLLSVGAAKYKTGTHSELSGFPTLAELGLEETSPAAAAAGADAAGDLNARIVAAVEFMRKANGLKIAADTAIAKAAPPGGDAAKNAARAADMELQQAIVTAFERECSKAASFSHIPRDKRQTVIDSLVPLVIKEVTKVYDEDGKPPPFSPQQLAAKVPNVIKNCVLKVPFDEAAAKAMQAK